MLMAINRILKRILLVSENVFCQTVRDIIDMYICAYYLKRLLMHSTTDELLNISDNTREMRP